MQHRRDAVALVTGASNDIGAAIARALSSTGLRVVLVAHRREQLESLAANGPGSWFCIRWALGDMRRADRGQVIHVC